MLQFFKFILS